MPIDYIVLLQLRLARAAPQQQHAVSSVFVFFFLASLSLSRRGRLLLSSETHFGVRTAKA